MRRFTTMLALTLLTGFAAESRAQEGPRVDVVFLLDATGSMGDEIQAVKDRIRAMISDIALGDPRPGCPLRHRRLPRPRRRLYDQSLPANP